MPLADIFTCTAILDGGPAIGKAEVIGRLVTLLAEAGHVPHADVPAVRDAVLRRERLGSTGIGRGLAIPNTRHHSVDRPLGILAVCRPPVEYDALDGEVVDIIALILTPLDRPGQHLGEASRGSEGLARCLADESFCQRLRLAESAEEIGEMLQSEGGMTRREWLACKNPGAMLFSLPTGRMRQRKARLYGAACCRRLWSQLPEEGRRAVEVAERYADGLAGAEDLEAARTAVRVACEGGASPAVLAVLHLAGEEPLRDNATAIISCDAADAAFCACYAGADAGELIFRKRTSSVPTPADAIWAAEEQAQAALLRCVLGDPFRPVPVAPSVLVWNDSLIPRLAQAAYDCPALPNGTLDSARLAVLADALEEAGADAELVEHLRRSGSHCRGCHVVDAVLGKG